MSQSRYRLLIVDDEPRMCQILKIAAEKWGYNVRTAANGHEALSMLDEFQPEIVVTDLKMPGMDGEELLRQLKTRSLEMPVVMMTAHGTVKSAVEAMRNGAYDYIMKPFEYEELRLTLSRATEYMKLKTDNAYLRRELGIRFRADAIVGSSAAMQQVHAMIERVAPTKATVLITGESGTGKELAARSVHHRSTRASGPFVAINCAALTETLLESELFGHERGAFTGANRMHRGKFEEADGGTIFLDEIGEVSNSFQTKLLRILQEGTLERVGGNATIRVDVRVIAATNKNLEALVEQGKFREDLFYRLKVVPIQLPSLRERREDIPELARHFIRKVTKESNLPQKQLSPEAIAAMQRADWRGNVRELENTIERAVILSRGDTIGVEDLWLPLGDTPLASLPGDEPTDPSAAAPSPPLRYGPAPHQPQVPADIASLPLAPFIDEMTKRRVILALDCTGWRKQEASDILGVDRATLYRMIKKFEIEQG